jgi:cytochrome bd-type quinol oxidase subunit 2
MEVAMSPADPSQIRTRMFARAFGPFFTIIPSIVAARATTQMPVLLHEFASDPMWQWVLGAFLLMGGSVIIAFHQYWRSAAAVLVSLLGWFLAIRGVLILAVPNIYNSAGNALERNDILVVRAIFIGLALVGLYLTYVGWIEKPKQQEPRDAASH